MQKYFFQFNINFSNIFGSRLTKERKLQVASTIFEKKWFNWPGLAVAVGQRITIFVDISHQDLVEKTNCWRHLS